MNNSQNVVKKVLAKLLQPFEKTDLFYKLVVEETVQSDELKGNEPEGREMEQDQVNSELVDEDVLQQMIKDTDAEIIPMLIDHYLEESQQRLERIKKAVGELDKETLEFEAHTLGSTALALGNRTLSNLARKIEHLCLDGQEEEAFSLHIELQSLAQRSLAALIKRKELGF